MLIGIDIVENIDTRKPDSDYATQVMNKALENGLYTRLVGRYGNVIALTPPLVLSKTQAMEAVRIFGKIIE